MPPGQEERERERRKEKKMCFFFLSRVEDSNLVSETIISPPRRLFGCEGIRESESIDQPS